MKKRNWILLPMLSLFVLSGCDTSNNGSDNTEQKEEKNEPQLVLSQTFAKMKEGETITVSASYEDALQSEVAWTSSDPTIAKVNSIDGKGVITALKGGDCVITAVYLRNMAKVAKVSIQVEETPKLKNMYSSLAKNMTVTGTMKTTLVSSSSSSSSSVATTSVTTIFGTDCYGLTLSSDDDNGVNATQKYFNVDGNVATYVLGRDNTIETKKSSTSFSYYTNPFTVYGEQYFSTTISEGDFTYFALNPETEDEVNVAVDITRRLTGMGFPSVSYVRLVSSEGTLTGVEIKTPVLDETDYYEIVLGFDTDETHDHSVSKPTVLPSTEESKKLKTAFDYFNKGSLTYSVDQVITDTSGNQVDRKAIVASDHIYVYDKNEDKTYTLKSGFIETTNASGEKSAKKVVYDRYTNKPVYLDTSVKVVNIDDVGAIDDSSTTDEIRECASSDTGATPLVFTDSYSSATKVSTIDKIIPFAHMDIASEMFTYNTNRKCYSLTGDNADLVTTYALLTDPFRAYNNSAESMEEVEIYLDDSNRLERVVFTNMYSVRVALKYDYSTPKADLDIVPSSLEGKTINDLFCGTYSFDFSMYTHRGAGTSSYNDTTTPVKSKLVVTKEGVTWDNAKIENIRYTINNPFIYLQFKATLPGDDNVIGTDDDIIAPIHIILYWTTDSGLDILRTKRFHYWPETEMTYSNVIE